MGESKTIDSVFYGKIIQKMSVLNQNIPFSKEECPSSKSVQFDFDSVLKVIIKFNKNMIS